MKKLKTTKSIKNKRKIMLACLGVGILSSTPLFLSACSGAVSQTLQEKTVYINDGTKISSNLSLSDFSKNALKSKAGMEAYLQDVNSSLILKWYELLSQKSNIASYRQSWSEQNQSINDEWDDLVDEYKSKYGSDWQARLQQDVLDVNGGTQASWKNSKWKSWAKDKFSSDLFSQDYLTILNKDTTSGETTSANPSRTFQSLLDVLEKNTLDGGNQTFGFSSLAKNDSIGNGDYIDVDNEYANFIQFIYDKWIEINNPYVVNMALWKYTTPKDGINSIYKNASTTTSSDTTTDDSTDSSTDSTTSTAGTYQFPYFSYEDTQEASGTLAKFTNFVNQSKTNANFLSSTGLPSASSGGKTWKDFGIKNISNNLTDDSSTLILAKNSSIYSDLYAEFAAASSYLFWQQTDATKDTELSADGTLIKNIDVQIGQTVGTPTEKDGFDKLTSLFVSTSQIANNNYQIKLSNQYLTQIINPNGPLKGLLTNNNDLYVLDSFKASDANLDDFMFIRNQAGVHAVSIDGWEWISKANTPLERKQRAGQILLYRSMLNTYFPSLSDLSIDIKSELQTFFNDNMDWLIYSYAKENKSENLFNLSNINITDNEKELAKTINTYLFEVSHYDKVSAYSEKLYSTKSAYSQNYGTNASKNGLAAPWTYKAMEEKDAKAIGLNETISFDVALTNYISYSPYLVDDTNKNPAPTVNGTKSYLPSSLNDEFVSKSKLFEKIDTLIDAMNMVPLNTAFEGFKYAQYIYVNTYTAINAALLAYGQAGSLMGNSVKENILETYITNSGIYNLTDNVFKLTDTENAALESGMSNFFYNSVFDSKSPLWTQYSGTSINPITQTDVNSYKKDLWFNSLNSLDETSNTSYLGYLTTIATVSYLLDNNASNFLTYLKSKISYGTDAYVAWSNGQNSYLETAKTTVEDLMSANTLQMNVNNSYTSSYVGHSGTIQTVTNNTNGIYNDVKSYYNVVNDMVGFLGLQTSASNSLPTVISNRLFTSQKLDNENGTGVLYSYGSKENLINIINNISTITDVVNLANSIKSKVKYFDISLVTDSKKTLKERKQALVNLVERLDDNTNEYFDARNGYIKTTDDKPIVDSTKDHYEYGAYVYQINYDNLESKESLLKALGSDNDVNKANNIFYNLVIQAATDSTLQSKVLATISSSNKVDIYDLRLNTQLGAQWANNWNEKATSSS